MDFKFDQLITQSIKRLTRPKVSNDFSNFYDHRLYRNDLKDEFSLDQMEVIGDKKTLKELQTHCEVSYDGIPANASLNFNSVFGKISQGEDFKALFTIQNSSSTSNVD